MRGETGREAVQRRLSSQGAGIWVGEVNVGRGWDVRKGRIQSSVVDIVALNALKEESKAATQYGLAISGHVPCKADTRLEGVVVVFDVSTWESVHARFPDAVEVELLGSVPGKVAQ